MYSSNLGVQAPVRLSNPSSTKSMRPMTGVCPQLELHRSQDTAVSDRPKSFSRAVLDTASPTVAMNVECSWVTTSPNAAASAALSAQKDAKSLVAKVSRSAANAGRVAFSWLISVSTGPGMEKRCRRSETLRMDRRV